MRRQTTVRSALGSPLGFVTDTVDTAVDTDLKSHKLTLFASSMKRTISSVVQPTIVAISLSEAVTSPRRGDSCMKHNSRIQIPWFANDNLFSAGSFSQSPG